MSSPRLVRGGTDHCFKDTGGGSSPRQSPTDSETLMDSPLDQEAEQIATRRQALQDKADRFDRFTRNLPAILYDYVIDPDGTGHCLYCSAYSQELLGIPPEEFLADMDRFWNMIHPDDLSDFRERDLKAYREAESFSMDVRVILSSGEEKWIRVSSMKNPPKGDEPAIWSGYMIDISETKRLEKMLQEQATHDSLTGLGNRSYFQQHFQTELQRKDRYQADSVLLLLDLDHFKRINDDFGHDAGDYVLKQVSDLIRAQLRNIDSLARWGGEEFCILLPATKREKALAVAERIRASLAEQPLNYQGQPIGVTTSIGLTALRAGDARIETVLRRADQALYRAKHNGRNRVDSD